MAKGKGYQACKTQTEYQHRQNPYGKRQKGTDIPSHYRGKQRPSPRWASRDPHSMDQQGPSPGRQRPSPTRAPTGTSRRVGIGQGDLSQTKEATSVSRMHGNHKEQYGSHSLNRWKGKICSLTQTCRNAQQGLNPTNWEASLAKECEPWWQGSVPPMMRDLGHSPTSDQC